MYTHKLGLKKFLALPIVVAPVVLGFAGAAFAQAPASTGATMPADQIVLTGACLSAAQVSTAAAQALNAYAIGDQPAGLIINGTWIPAALAATGEQYVNGCAGPLLPANSNLLPTDQIVVSGNCPTQAQVTTAATDALSLYATGDQPAGVVVNGIFVPAGVASTADGTLLDNLCGS